MFYCTITVLSFVIVPTFTVTSLCLCSLSCSHLKGKLKWKLVVTKLHTTQKYLCHKRACCTLILARKLFIYCVIFDLLYPIVRYMRYFVTSGFAILWFCSTGVATFFIIAFTKIFVDWDVSLVVLSDHSFCSQNDHERSLDSVVLSPR